MPDSHRDAWEAHIGIGLGINRTAAIPVSFSPLTRGDDSPILSKPITPKKKKKPPV